MKKCSKCQTFLPHDNFSKGTNSGYSSYCKTCAHEYYKNRYSKKLKTMKTTSTHKQCRVCEKLKPYSDYASKDGKSRKKETYCKECKKFMGTERVLKRYGLTVDDYMELFNAQKGLCKICEKPEREGKRLAVDHDHSCCPGAKSCGMCIRGLLCARCNRTLGMVEDRIEYLKGMILYLQNF